MQKWLKKSALVVAAALAVGVLASEAKAVIVYNSNTTTGADGAYFDTTPAAAQRIALAVPAGAPVQINSFTVFGIRNGATARTAGSTALILEFYSNADPSLAATDALASASLLGSVGYNLPAMGADSSFNFNLPGVNVVIPGSVSIVTVAAYVTNSTGTALLPGTGFRYSTGTPTVGATDGVVWIDSNLDATFAGSERVRFNGALSGQPVPTNLRMTIDATIIPEPSALGLLAPAAMLLGRRRK